MSEPLPLEPDAVNHFLAALTQLDPADASVLLGRARELVLKVRWLSIPDAICFLRGEARCEQEGGLLGSGRPAQRCELRRDHFGECSFPDVEEVPFK